jgi:alpha-glucosidase
MANHRNAFFRAIALGLFLLAGSQFSFAAEISTDGRRVKITQGNRGLLIEAVSDEIVHFEFSANQAGQDVNKRIYTTPMVYQTDLLPASVTVHPNGLSTNNLEISVHPETLCVRSFDKIQNKTLVLNCPLNLEQPWKGITLEMDGIRNLYGLGNYFMEPGTSDGDWMGRVWDPLADKEGNALRGFNGGATSYAQFPILYALGSEYHSFGLFLDQLYKQMWEFRVVPARVEMSGDQIRWYVISGNNLQAIRRKYMSLTGKPPMPPKKALGLWISEFGFENWPETYKPVVTLRQNGFPLDGLGMDIQWFGGRFYAGGVGNKNSRMGTLKFDETNFPNPAHELSHLRKERGVNLMLIEESYVSKRLPEHDDLAERRYLAHKCDDNEPVFVTQNPWWGVGGMIDWSNPAAGDYWHDVKRQPLYDLGVTEFWTDLGEPEMYDSAACYHGFPEIGKRRHPDIHNIYNFKWIESIARGFQRRNNELRPYFLSRSGTSGLQRFGAGMWSGDIGANMGSLTAHYRVHTNMSLAGIDYFSSDVGGFHRRSDTLDGDPHELYTQWFAAASLFDFPVRSHTWDLANNLSTQPDEMGHPDSNRFNIHQRYRLSPYYYSLAYQAHREGEPLVPPLVYYFQNDVNVRLMGNQKMIGPFLMGALVARYGETQRNVYLPKGAWFNFHSDEAHQSSGEAINDVPAKQGNIFRPPLFARGGAIIPMMFVDSKTMNILGRREGEAPNTDLYIRVYPDATATEFLLYEDDGETIRYKNNEFATTRITQRREGNLARITVEPTTGGYPQLPSARNQHLEIIFNSAKATAVSVNGGEVAACSSEAELQGTDRCWVQPSNQRLLVKTGRAAVGSNKSIEVKLQ